LKRTLTGADTDHVKVVKFSKKSENIITKSGKNDEFEKKMGTFAYSLYS